jgi:hypothetical protein
MGYRWGGIDQRSHTKLRLFIFTRRPGMGTTFPTFDNNACLLRLGSSTGPCCCAPSLPFAARVIMPFTSRCSRAQVASWDQNTCNADAMHPSSCRPQHKHWRGVLSIQPLRLTPTSHVFLETGTRCDLAAQQCQNLNKCAVYITIIRTTKLF